MVSPWPCRTSGRTSKGGTAVSLRVTGTPDISEIIEGTVQQAWEWQLSQTTPSRASASMEGDVGRSYP